MFVWNEYGLSGDLSVRAHLEFFPSEPVYSRCRKSNSKAQMSAQSNAFYLLGGRCDHRKFVYTSSLQRAQTVIAFHPGLVDSCKPDWTVPGMNGVRV